MLEEKGSKIFGAYLDRTIRVVRLDLIRRFKEVGADITPEQWIILSSLAEQDGQSQSELANGSFKNAPTVSRIIDLLCDKGLTVRKRFGNEKRRKKIMLTEKGRETIQLVLPVVIEARQQGWEGLSDQDYKDFIRIINTIFRNIGAE